MKEKCKHDWKQLLTPSVFKVFDKYGGHNSLYVYCTKCLKVELVKKENS